MFTSTWVCDECKGEVAADGELRLPDGWHTIDGGKIKKDLCSLPCLVMSLSKMPLGPEIAVTVQLHRRKAAGSD